MDLFDCCSVSLAGAATTLYLHELADSVILEEANKRKEQEKEQKENEDKNC